MKKLFIILFMILSTNVVGQNHNLISQYFQVMPFYAPGLTGANDFLDIRTGARKQWVDFNGAPLSYFIGGSGILKIGGQNLNKYNSVRVGNDSPYHRKTTKFGLGGYIFDESIGEFKQFGSMISGAVHVSITNSVYLSLGFTTGYHNARLDANNLTVLNPANDALYQDYLQNGAQRSFFKLNAGLAAYSEKFYISYAQLNMVNTEIGRKSNLLAGGSGVLHTVIGGYRMSISPDYELIPATYVRFANDIPFLIDGGARIRYKQFIYMGMSYRNDQTVIGVFGLNLNNMYSFGYSIERKNVNYGGLAPLSHEIVIGIQLFNSRKYTSLW